MIEAGRLMIAIRDIAYTITPIRLRCQSIYTPTHTHTYTHAYIYIYKHKEREREREREIMDENREIRVN